MRSMTNILRAFNDKHRTLYQCLNKNLNPWQLKYKKSTVNTKCETNVKINMLLIFSACVATCRISSVFILNVRLCWFVGSQQRLNSCASSQTHLVKIVLHLRFSCNTNTLSQFPTIDIDKWFQVNMLYRILTNTVSNHLLVFYASDTSNYIYVKSMIMNRCWNEQVL